jgi:ribosomal protein S18 acetylase RimI-like enzyme
MRYGERRVKPAHVRIIELPVDRWREYRTLRLTALQTDPIAFANTYEETLSYPDELWQDRLTNSTSINLFAERDDRLIGTAAALLGMEGDATIAQIVGVFVEPECRGQGVARLILETLLARLAGRPEIARIRLNVTETQAPAIALYRSLGFMPVRRLVGERRRGDRIHDELVMERDNARIDPPLDVPDAPA